jgi:hypothetical protein
MIVTPCPLCQANVEVYQSEINKKQGTKLNMPVLYYSQLMTVAYGGSAKEAGLDGQLIWKRSRRSNRGKSQSAQYGEWGLSSPRHLTRRTARRAPRRRGGCDQAAEPPVWPRRAAFSRRTWIWRP